MMADSIFLKINPYSSYLGIALELKHALLMLLLMAPCNIYLIYVNKKRKRKKYEHSQKLEIKQLINLVPTSSHSKHIYN